MRLLLEGCHGYFLVPSLITKHLCHQFSRHQFPCSSISDELNNQPMGYIRCYAYNFSEIIFLSPGDFSRRVWVCGRILQGNYTLIESFRLLHPGTQCHIVHLKHKCKFIIFASSNFAELTLFHVMVDDRQKCYAFPEQQENKTLK